jgi:hypothetical protein
MYTGSVLNSSDDAELFGDFSDRWINAFERGGATDAMQRDFESVLDAHCAPLTEDGPAWGWKEPRSIYLLPFWNAQLPTLKFLHVVRDGRDMAFSSNQNQLRKHGEMLLSPAQAEWTPAERSIALWNRVNARAADFGAEHLGERYLCLRFEDLCAQPVATVQRLLDFFELQADATELAQHIVVPPPSLARWQQHDHQTIDRLQTIARASLRRFGYLHE